VGSFGTTQVRDVDSAIVGSLRGRGAALVPANTLTRIFTTDVKSGLV
jgi:hypothetical protein